MAYLSAPTQGNWLSPGQVNPAEVMTAADMIRARQNWTLGLAAAYADGYLTENEIKPQYRHGPLAVQGGFLPLKEIEPQFISHPTRHHQSFGALSPLPQQGRVPGAQYARDPGTYLRPSSVRNLKSGRSLADERQDFSLGGRNSQHKSPLPQQNRHVPGAQYSRDPGTYVNPRSIDELTRANAMASQRQRFSLGALPSYTLPAKYYQQGAVPAARFSRYSGGTLVNPSSLEGRSPLPQQGRVPGMRYARDPGTYVNPAALMGLGQINYVDPTAALRSAYVERSIRLDPICDAKGNCIRWATDAEINKAIGAKVDGQSALRTGKFQLPSYYNQPSLPGGIDPIAAYQAWAAQQAYAQNYLRTPLAIFGSPGMRAPQFQPIMGTGYAQPAAYNPSAGQYPTAGSAVERF